ncbi:hypothetical protein ELS82_24190 [Vibrio ouci]|uniref:Uncharacterized protein n=1 Tax=Vibrio ouci TaxID=2499078 RepID=A0A4Y8W959_9VIBR|nr:hypothetical protein ELS82_24190 [Vibrio ouci]
MKSSSDKKWKKRYGYHKRSLLETAMYRVNMKHGFIVFTCRKALIFQEYNHENRSSQFPTSHVLGCK